MSVNKVILLGNVGKDPEVRYFDNGGAVANFTLATTEKGYTAANGTQIPDRTEWHNIVLWRGLAEVAEKYVKKGTKLFIEGKIRTRSYDDSAGNKRYVTEIYGDVMEMLSSNPGGAANASANAAPFPQPPVGGGSSAPNEVKQPPVASAPSPIGGSQDDEKDDLPF